MIDEHWQLAGLQAYHPRHRASVQSLRQLTEAVVTHTLSKQESRLPGASRVFEGRLVEKTLLSDSWVKKLQKAFASQKAKRATSRATGLVQQSTTLTLLNLALVVASMFVVHSAPSQQIATPAGFTALFNGTDFSGWRGGDTFDHRAWLAMPEAERSNVFIREIPADEANGSGDPAYVGMCKIPVLDDSSERFRNNDPRQANGSAYGMVAGQRGYLRAPGQWNFEQITIKGSTILVELNGTTILDADLAEVTDFLANHPHPGKERTLATSELPAIVIQFSSGPSASSNCPDGPERSRRSGDAYRLEAISQRISISLKLGLGILGWKTCDSVGVLCCLWRIHARFPRTDRAG